MNLLALLGRDARWSAGAAVLAGAASGAGGVGLIALIQASLNHGDAAAPQLAWAFVGLCGVVLLTRIVSQALVIRLSQGTVYRLHERLSRQILATPLRTLEEIGSPRLLAGLTDDVLGVANALAGLPLLGINVVIVVCCLVYLGWLSVAALLAVLLFLIVGVVTYQALAVLALRRLEAARGHHDSLMKHFRGLTEGVKELKVHGERRGAFLDGLLLGAAASFRARNTAGLTLYAVAGSWGQLLFLAAIGLVVFALPGSPYVSWGARSGAALAILYAAGPLETVVSWTPILGRAQVGLRKIEALGLSLAAGGVEDEALAKSAPAAPLECLELLGVTHAYRREGEPGGFLLGPVDLTLRPGEILFLAGGNGSGKTTLAKVLTGLYTPEGGEIRLNGRPVADAGREAYRRLFSAVFADFYLFDQLLGLGDAADERGRDYLARLGLAHKVEVKNGKFSTTDLSQGQRKRLALLIACLEDRPVYVFDEWAADQDPRFKEFFYTRLLSELKDRGKAVFVITHDERYFHLADRLVRLDEGKIDLGAVWHETVVGCN